MSWHFTASVLLYVLSGAGTRATAWMTNSQRRQPGVMALTTAMLGAVFWSFFGALEVAAVDWPAKFAFVALGYSAGVVVVLCVFFFVLEYYGQAGWLTPRKRWLLWAPGGVLRGRAEHRFDGSLCAGPRVTTGGSGHRQPGFGTLRQARNPQG
jgi:hypothetical protein